VIALDRQWLKAHPLPPLDPDTDKNERGRVFIVGGSAFVPGALRLTGEAALRAGAGKLQFGTVSEAALLLGMSVPEAGVVGLASNKDGEIAASAADQVIEHASSCNALVLGPGMRGSDECSALVSRVVEALPATVAIILDAGAIAAAASCRDLLRARSGALILTPHHGEMAALSGLDVEQISEDCEAAARQVAKDLNAVVALKAATTVITSPAGECLQFDGGTPALATGGSGDVLAGIVGGLAARGAGPLVATAWSVWAHGKAGEDLARELGGPGLLSRDLLPRLPKLLNSA
jgi:hydroxyethylthiazole kinase-like uncharacterized protein yjeF